MPWPKLRIGTRPSRLARVQVEMVRAAGATEVHMRIASPPTMHSCHYGVDTPDSDKLVAANLDLEGLRKHIGVESLAYISMDGLYKAMGQENGRDPATPHYCDACFSGEYPIALSDLDSGAGTAQLSLLAEQNG